MKTKQITVEQINSLRSNLDSLITLINAPLVATQEMPEETPTKKENAVKSYHPARYNSRQGKKIPADIKSRIKDLLETGQLTNSDISKKFGISMPSVTNIKKELGIARAYTRN